MRIPRTHGTNPPVTLHPAASVVRIVLLLILAPKRLLVVRLGRLLGPLAGGHTTLALSDKAERKREKPVEEGRKVRRGKCEEAD